VSNAALMKQKNLIQAVVSKAVLLQLNTWLNETNATVKTRIEYWLRLKSEYHFSFKSFPEVTKG